MDEMKKYIIEFSEDPHTIRLMKIKNGDECPITEFKTVEPYTEPDMEQVRKEAYDKCMDEAEMLAYKLYSPKIDKAYQKGLADAWEAARKLWEYDITTLKEIFGEGVMRMDWFMKFTASEAIEKIREYEQKQEESKKEQSVTVEEVMRQYLETFCVHEGGCLGCPLHTPDFTCGRGYHFFTNKPVSDEEVRRAYATVLQDMKEN